MANTYTQIHIQAVFAVQNRACIIRNSLKEELYKYISGILQSNNHKLFSINDMPDHIHIFIGYDPNQKIPDLIETIKTDSNHFIKKPICSKKLMLTLYIRRRKNSVDTEYIQKMI